jgi:thymidine phosphorylase
MSGAISIPELLRKKRDGDELTSEEINFFIHDVVNNRAQDCQIGNIIETEWCLVKFSRKI